MEQNLEPADAQAEITEQIHTAVQPNLSDLAEAQADGTELPDTGAQHGPTTADDEPSSARPQLHTLRGLGGHPEPARSVPELRPPAAEASRFDTEKDPERLARVIFLGAVPELMVATFCRHSFAVDVHVQPDVARSRGVPPCDFSCPDAREDIRNTLRHGDVALLYCVPSCSTASRARDRPVPRRLVEKGWPDAPRLRSDSQPRGFEDLLQQAPREVLNVRMENEFADFAGEFMRDFSGPLFAVAIENPRNSYLWACGLEKGISIPTAGRIDFDLCMRGGSRDTGMRLVCNPVEAFGHLAGLCDGRHVHEGFGTAATRRIRGAYKSLPYPRQLCEELAEIAISLATARGLRLGSPRRPPGTPSRTADDRTGAGLQSRGDGHIQLVPEYEAVAEIPILPAHLEAVGGRVGDRLEEDIEVGGVRVPKGGRLLRVVEPREGGLAAPTRGWFTTWDKDPAGGGLYVGRRYRDSAGRVFPESQFANPYRLSSCSSRQDCLDKFKSYLYARRDFPEVLRQLAGRELVCHCAPELGCHVDVLIEAFSSQVVVPSIGPVAHVGLPWTMDKFTEAARQARQARHPFDELLIPDAMKKGIVDSLVRGVSATMEYREELVLYWERRARELEPDEKDVRDAMHSDVRRAMRGKRLLVLGEGRCSLRWATRTRTRWCRRWPLGSASSASSFRRECTKSRPRTRL